MYLASAPTLLFEQPQLKYGTRTFLLALVFAHQTTGQTSLEGDTEDEYYEFNFVNTPQFPVPRIAYVMFDKKEIDKDDLLFYVYLCYMSFKTKSYDLTLDFDLIQKKTNLSKQKIKNSLDKFSTDEYVPVLQRISSKRVILTALEPQMIDSVHQIAKEMKELFGKMPQDVKEMKVFNLLSKDHEELGMNWKEQVALIEFIRYASQETYTMDEIVTSITGADQRFSEFELHSAIKKAEEQEMFKLIKNKDGVLRLEYQ